jgi:HPt (histidine-containing phosphotransfer) domain-containing protein
MRELHQESLTQLRDLKMEDGSGPLLNRLIDVYNSESPKLMANLVSAFRTGSMSEIEMAAHTLKSSSAQLGALEFSETCRQIEMMGKGMQSSDELRNL